MLTEILRELGSTWTGLTVAALAMVGIYVSVIFATRAFGPRSLAQMSAFDFVATVATGSITASAGTGSVPLADAVAAVVVLFAMQYIVGIMRRHRALGGRIDNTPLLLVRDGEVLLDNLLSARLTHDDLRLHLRQANVTDIRAVRAVVLETTGGVSVMQGEGDLASVLQGVRGAEGREGPTGQLSAG